MTKSKYDWVIINAEYETGKTLAQLRMQFGFSPVSWDLAVKRGDIKNPRNNQQQYSEYIEQWLAGLKDGFSSEFGISNHIRRWLYEKYNSSCAICGWNQINLHTGKIPLQIHHIDGDYKNNSSGNLQLLCPNCHALTDNFGSRGNGRPKKNKVYRRIMLL